MNRLFELFGEDAEKGKPLRAVVIHANREEEADQIIEELSQQYAHVEFYKSYFFFSRPDFFEGNDQLVLKMQNRLYF